MVPPLPTGIPPLKDDNRKKSLVFDPCLKLAKLRLEASKFLHVLLVSQPAFVLTVLFSAMDGSPLQGMSALLPIQIDEGKPSPALAQRTTTDRGAA